MLTVWYFPDPLTHWFVVIIHCVPNIVLCFCYQFTKAFLKDQGCSIWTLKKAVLYGVVLTCILHIITSILNHIIPSYKSIKLFSFGISHWHRQEKGENLPNKGLNSWIVFLLLPVKQDDVKGNMKVQFEALMNFVWFYCCLCFQLVCFPIISCPADTSSQFYTGEINRNLPIGDIDSNKNVV